VMQGTDYLCALRGNSEPIRAIHDVHSFQDGVFDGREIGLSHLRRMTAARCDRLREKPITPLVSDQVVPATAEVNRQTGRPSKGHVVSARFWPLLA
ncbi:hypothetical protein, partial [Pseudomonas nitroreducens]|uniref:hypothetical protein n=1 Tax=Pseudomonas nitroreducens TaxID=46680 RepID=UPI001A8CB031